MSTVPYVRKKRAPDTYYLTFKAVKHELLEGSDSSAGTLTNDTGKSPVSRWLAYAFDYEDFASNPDAVGYMVKCQIPRGTLALRCLARVDTAFVNAVAAADIDVGDGNEDDGWLDGVSFATTGLKVDPDAEYNYNGVTAGVLYQNGDTMDVLWKNATAPTAGEAIVFLECISYHEALSEEW